MKLPRPALTRVAPLPVALLRLAAWFTRRIAGIPNIANAEGPRLLEDKMSTSKSCARPWGFGPGPPAPTPNPQDLILKIALRCSVALTAGPANIRFGSHIVVF